MLTHKIMAPKAIRTPKFLDFADKAFGSLKEQYPEIEPALEWMENSIGVPDRAVIVAIDDCGDYVGLIVIDAHIGPWNQSPWVLFAYADGDGVLHALTDASTAWGRDNGYDSCQSINMSSLPDDVYIRAMGYPGEVVGSCIRFELEKESRDVGR